MRQRARELADIPAQKLWTATGLRASPYVAELIGEDLVGFGRYLASPSARRAERDRAASANSAEECFAFAQAHFGVGPVQNLAEIGWIGVIRYRRDQPIAAVLAARTPPE